MSTSPESKPAGRRIALAAWLAFGLLVVGAYVWLGGHRSHVALLLPYLILLACPLMHLFHGHWHGGHRGHHGGPGSGTPAVDARHAPRGRSGEQVANE